MCSDLHHIMFFKIPNGNLTELQVTTIFQISNDTFFKFQLRSHSKSINFRLIQVKSKGLFLNLGWTFVASVALVPYLLTMLYSRGRWLVECNFSVVLYTESNAIGFQFRVLNETPHNEHEESNSVHIKAQTNGQCYIFSHPVSG